MTTPSVLPGPIPNEFREDTRPTAMLASALLFVNPIAGVLIGRTSRKGIMILSDVSRFFIVLCFIFVDVTAQKMGGGNRAMLCMVGKLFDGNSLIEGVSIFNLDF